MLTSILATSSSGAVTLTSFLICAAVSLVLGMITAFAYMYKNHYSKGFAVSLALLPLIIQVVITLVNGNLGVGVAVAGAFSLIRFRSAQGGGRELVSIFLAMAVGLATGMGYVGIAAILVVIACLVQLVLLKSRFGEGKKEKELRITIPENLDYEGVFDDLFEKYTASREETRIRTASMGSVYELSYNITMKEAGKEKSFIDEIRERNGNLNVSLGRISTAKEEL